ncbi:Rne/Rng family ribonuclease [Sphingomonas sp.]|uniref:Rne/Rng family ribonuclease n=1 Tax=Sphingomonas sp. TaxID=28214 RepID=UPI00286C6B51|nr:Rne/Rng family ribonuclease [Sphingomonas sp.]
MSMRMLIDARHPEETRVAVAKGNRIEELDFESQEHQQLKGNIYLAKVTRVEPSLQAAFIDYGGNRHGFLAFSEIHPDYYQIPKSDRDALLREEAEHAAEEERLRGSDDYDDHEDAEAYESGGDSDGFADDIRGEGDENLDDDHQDDENGEPRVAETGTGSARSPVDESAADELRKKRQALRRRYKIQDVIQRRQVLLVQVVKEERGNKGAALTTYLSLAGRYCVLMPNTSHGGGISRKISNGADRKRLKSIMGDLSLPTSMGLIVRTAGLQRTKVEIKRDFDYLARLWDEIRERTLGSSAPALIYRDSDLIKRAIRDLYHREIDVVIVEGDEGYTAARGFMKLLMPSHVKKVINYSDPTPIFQRYGVEDQLSAMYQPLVQLKSGGYLVINPTEALVSIDINSGRSTREHNIEQTANATNIEAAHEIARQLRLRDMAGLVVIDFIDMEQSSHNRKVEKAMKDALKNDRARIQVGRISSFGLMEMSRQRLRTGVLEASTRPCAHCEGTGLMRTASSAGLSALRIIEDEAARGRGDRICLRAGREAAIYVLNKKRAELAEIEERYGVQVEVLVDESFEGARMAVDSQGNRPVVPVRAVTAPIVDDVDDEFVDEVDDVEEVDDRDDAEDGEERADRSGSDDRGPREDGDGARRRRRRRRGGRGRSRREDGSEIVEGSEPRAEGEAADDQLADDGGEEARQPEAAEGDDQPRRSRRGRRGGRGGRRERGYEGDAPVVEGGDVAADAAPMVEPVTSLDPPSADEVIEPLVEEGPKTRRRPRARKADAAPAVVTEASVTEAPAPTPEPEVVAAEDTKPKRKPRAKKVVAAAEPAETQLEAAPAKAAPATAASTDTAEAAPVASNDGAEDPADKPRKGWWARTIGA